jgi:hypothetical protein
MLNKKESPENRSSLHHEYTRLKPRKILIGYEQKKEIV